MQVELMLFTDSGEYLGDIEADDKHFARIKILRTVCERVEAALG